MLPSLHSAIDLYFLITSPTGKSSYDFNISHSYINLFEFFPDYFLRSVTNNFFKIKTISYPIHYY